jgi:plastocyanin
LHETVQNISYQNTCLAAPGGSPFTIDFDNRDTGIPHNMHIFSTDPATDPQARSLFVGPLVTGPKMQAYHVPALPPGTYYFHCDIHPMQMQGTFIVR